MQSLQTIKRRLKSVNSVGKITKAMELVAATKMRKSQQVALDSRPYVFAALELLRNLERALKEKPTSPLLEKRTILRTAYVVVASDKGLTGAFNSNVFRAFDRFLANFGSPTSVNVGNLVSNWKLSFQEACFVAVGEKSRLYLNRKGITVNAVFTKFGDITTPQEVGSLGDYLIEGYLAKKWDKVVVFYTNFKSALTQEVITREILPVDEMSIEQTAKDIIPESGRFAEMLGEKGLSFFDTDLPDAPTEYIIEPSAGVVLNALLPHLIRMQMYHIILEANASEHSARRLAMKNASDNASDLADDLSQEYNKSRQAVITRELTEITAGASAIQN